MFARAHSGSVIGVDGHEVVVECSRGSGLPGLVLIGLARGAVKESAVRVRAAVRACGLSLPSHRVVVNLLPAELPKDASALDLAMAVALLTSAGLLAKESLQGRRFLGELSLGGGVEPVRGAVLIADLARRRDDRELIVPAGNAAEAAVIPGIRIVGVATLEELIAHLRGERVLTASSATLLSAPRHEAVCLSEVRGQLAARRALEIAAAGGHNLLMVGPPGSGKTMLARRLPTLLPALSAEEAIAVTRINSVAGRSRQTAELTSERPFRAPHHTASEAALCGGGSNPRPGEITLAHHGVLFLDEFPEFSRRSLEALREPLEEGCIRVARAACTVTFPARLMLVAAMNPCPCGYLEPPRGRQHVKLPHCFCSMDQIQRYRHRISGPLLDRIDLHVRVESLAMRDLLNAPPGEPSVAVRQRVTTARDLQERRLGRDRTNSSLTRAELERVVPLDPKALAALERGIAQIGLSARALTRVMRVARTIADLAGGDSVELSHIEEALGLRLLDGIRAPVPHATAGVARPLRRPRTSRRRAG